MIGLVYLLRRLPNLSLKEFQRYWDETHGPLVAWHTTSLRICRYGQNHTIQDPLNDSMQKVRGAAQGFYDCVDELWWNNREDLANALATPEGRRAAQDLVEDERKFIDFSHSSLCFAIQLPVINPLPENIVATEKNTLLKFLGVVRRPPNQSFEECQLHWRMNHGPLVRRYAATVGIRRYIQLHTIEDPLTDQLRTARGTMEEPFEGLAQVWWDRVEMAGLQATPEYQRAWGEIQKDERNFVDFSRGPLGFTKERVFIDK